jgi:hypothetical protein
MQSEPKINEQQMNKSEYPTHILVSIACFFMREMGWLREALAGVPKG